MVGVELKYLILMKKGDQLFKKKLTFDPDELATLRQQVFTLEKIESGVKSEFGKILLKAIQDYFDRAIYDFTTKDISTFNDGQVIAFAYSIRGKIQILHDFKKLLEKASEDKELLIKELQQYKDLEA